SRRCSWPACCSGQALAPGIAPAPWPSVSRPPSFRQIAEVLLHQLPLLLRDVGAVDLAQRAALILGKNLFVRHQVILHAWLTALILAASRVLRLARDVDLLRAARGLARSRASTVAPRTLAWLALSLTLTRSLSLSLALARALSRTLALAGTLAPALSRALALRLLSLP